MAWEFLLLIAAMSASDAEMAVPTPSDPWRTVHMENPPCQAIRVDPWVEEPILRQKVVEGCHKVVYPHPSPPHIHMEDMSMPVKVPAAQLHTREEIVQKYGEPLLLCLGCHHLAPDGGHLRVYDKPTDKAEVEPL